MRRLASRSATHAVSAASSSTTTTTNGSAAVGVCSRALPRRTVWRRRITATASSRTAANSAS